MRTTKFWPVAAACAAVYAAPLFVWAQPPADAAPPPPQLEKLDEGEAPAVTIHKPGQERKVAEKRARGGQVTEVKVTSGKSTYYLKPNDPAGSALPGDTQSNAARAAQWKIMEFDLRREDEAKRAEAERAIPAPPAAPAGPAKK